MLAWGPQALQHTQRMAIAHEIAERLKERFHPEVVAIGLYGSLAREEDGPFSDIEMFGVLQANQYEQRYEWCTTTGTRVISEAVTLPDLPDGFRELGHMILTGDLRDGQQLGTACERLWQGLNIWAEGHGYQIISPQKIPF